jgi:hypothetical protein
MCWFMVSDEPEKRKGLRKRRPFFFRPTSLRGEGPRSICNVDYMTLRFRVPEIVGPKQAWRLINAERAAP